jgi:hypothetical protein
MPLLNYNSGRWGGRFVKRHLLVCILQLTGTQITGKEPFKQTAVPRSAVVPCFRCRRCVVGWRQTVVVGITGRLQHCVDVSSSSALGHKYSNLADVFKISERDWASCCLLAHTHYNANGSISGNGERFWTKMLVSILFRWRGELGQEACLIGCVKSE